MRNGAFWACAWLLAVAPGCAGQGPLERPAPEELGWPPGDPRVRLDAVVRLDSPRGWRGARILSTLAGHAQSSAFVRPYAAAWDGADLLVADPDAGRVARVAPGGRTHFSPPGELESPIGLAVCPQGIVVTDSRAGAVALLDRDLRRRRWLAEGLARPTGVACSGDRIFVVETGKHRVLILAGAGEPKVLGRRGAGPGQFNFPTAVVLDGGSLIVGDALNFRVQRLDASSGELLESFGQLGDAPGEMPRIKGMAVDGAGLLWVSDAHLDQVAIYDAGGVFLAGIGATGSGPGEFAFPAGVAAHADGRVAVVDSLNRRVQVFRPVAGREGGR